MVLIWS